MLTTRGIFNGLGLILPGVLVGAFWWAVIGLFWIGAASGLTTMVLLAAIDKGDERD